MFFSIVLFCSLFFSFIVKGNLENLLIVLFSCSFYKVFIIDKNYKSLIYGFFISYFIVNFFIVFGIRDYILIREDEPTITKSQTLVLIVSEGENRTYNIRERATQIYQEKGYKSFFSSIFELNKYKNYYIDTGNSTFKKKTEEISKKLNNNLGSEYMVVNSYLFSAPYLEQMIEIVISRGYNKIIICPLFMTDGKDYDVFINRFKNVELASRNINEVSITTPFYDNDEIVELYKKDILRNIEKLNEDSGVLLVGLQNKNNIEQDILLRQKIQKSINDEKNDLDIKIKLPLLENNELDIVKSAEELLEYGIHSLYFVTPTTLLDTKYTENLVNKIYKQLDLGYTDFFYVDPEEEVDYIVDAIINKIDNEDFKK
ncbi:MAG: hypothetical protein R3Y64_02030 [Peptostreptococcaceae bacterium]